jgi:DNA-binding NtrC family response regulator
MLDTCLWPGNVRQLKHCIERAVALHAGGPIDSQHLLEARDPATDSSATAVAAAAPAATLRYQNARADFEQEYFRNLLDAAGGNVSEAARLSGIPRQNLYVRMKRWEIVTD